MKKSPITKEGLWSALDAIFARYSKDKYFMTERDVKKFVEDCFASLGKKGEAKEENFKQVFTIFDPHNLRIATKEAIFDVLWDILSSADKEYQRELRKKDEEDEDMKK